MPSPSVGSGRTSSVRAVEEAEILGPSQRSRQLRGERKALPEVRWTPVDIGVPLLLLLVCTAALLLVGGVQYLANKSMSAATQEVHTEEKP